VSGDGLIHEVVNALYRRDDHFFARTIPLGMIPGGSSDAFCKSVTFESGEEHSIEHAAFLICKGRTR
jgi:diacylglycerol kinase family enzyme